jgi:hypothetical protein
LKASVTLQCIQQDFLQAENFENIAKTRHW